MVRPCTGNPICWTCGSGSLDTIACSLVASAWPLTMFVCISITESSWPVCACSGKDIECWSDCKAPSQPLNQVSNSGRLLFSSSNGDLDDIWLFGKHFEGPSSNAPFNLCFHSFFTRISRWHKSYCISTSKRSQILGPPFVCKDLLFLLSEKLLIDLGLEKLAWEAEEWWLVVLLSVCSSTAAL